MAIIRNNHAFKGHKTLLGAKYVTYAEMELPLRYDIFALSKSGFDWGNTGSGAQQLAFSILYQLSDAGFAKNSTSSFVKEVVAHFNRDWIITASEVVAWIEKNGYVQDKKETKEQKEIPANRVSPKKSKSSKSSKKQKDKNNIVKDICSELQITQKDLAAILEIPEGTVSSWAVKNEIPRLGKKAIEFYIQSQKNQEIVDSYKSFVKLLDVS